MFDIYIKKLFDIYEKIMNLWFFNTTKYKKLEEFEMSKISAKFNDSIAQQISWLPLINKSNFFSCKYNFKTNDEGKLIFTLDGIYLVIDLTLIFIGLMGLYSIANNIFEGKFTFDFAFLSLFIGFIGVIKYLYDSRPLIFDKNVGFFYKGKYKNDLDMYKNNFDLNTYQNNLNNFGSNKISDNILLKDIYAIQLLHKKNIGTHNSYIECNLIFNNLKRINIFNQMHLGQTLKNAEKIGSFLGIPVWDFTDFIILEGD